MSGMFKPLGAEDIECRIAQVRNNGLSLLLYKTARTDANVLDKVVGVANWQNDYKVIDGTLFCGIGIHTAENGWVWKWDAGSESNVEKQKGEASDAFKRAGFRFGIGRELYTAPFIWIPSGKCQIKDGKCFDRFRVAAIEYDDDKITHLVVENVTMGATVFWWERDGAVQKPATEDDKPWDAPKTAKGGAKKAPVATDKMTQAQVSAIVDLVKETFCGRSTSRDAFHAVTGYTVQQLAARQIPAAEYDTIISKLTMEPEDAVRVIEEIEKNASKTA